MTETGPVTPKQEALRGLPPEWREQLIEAAVSMGIRAEHDTAWLLVKSFVNAWAAAAAAGAAAEKTSGEVMKIPELLYRGTMQASKDLTAQVTNAGAAISKDFRAQGIELGKAVVIAIDHAAKTGATAITRAAVGFEDIATSRRDAMITEWQTALAETVAVQARITILGKLAMAWGSVTASLLIAAAAGAMVAMLVLSQANLLSPALPAGWRIVHANGWDELFIARPIQLIPGCSRGETCLATRRD